MKSHHYLAFSLIVGVFHLQQTIAKSYSSFTCSGGWALQHNDTKEMTETFQNWIYAWQNTCSKKLYDIAPPTGGMGASTNVAVRDIVSAFERDRVYRPHDGVGIWVFAEANASLCTLNMRSIDCYSQPISVCGFNESSITHELDKIHKDISFMNYAMDSCEMAKLARKPLQWVAAQFTAYIIRLGDSIKDEVHALVAQVYGDASRAQSAHSLPHQHHKNHLLHQSTHTHNTSHHTFVNHTINLNMPRRKLHFVDNLVHISSTTSSTNSTDGTVISTTPQTPRRMPWYGDSPMFSNMSTIGVHVRQGKLDFGRSVLGLKYYIDIIDNIASKLRNTSRPVGLVFLCSHIQEENVVSSEHMQSTYKRDFKFLVLPHEVVGHNAEIEYVLKDKANPLASTMNRHAMAVQYYADLEVLSRADYFVGSNSNMYTVVASMRIVNGMYKHANDTCLVDFRSGDLVCEGDESVKALYRTEHNGGFLNPTPHMDWIEMPV